MAECLSGSSTDSTEPVYFSDTYLLALDGAKVTKIEKPDDGGDKVVIVTDKTIMHPQGGGQPSDQGEILCSVDGHDLVFQVQHVSKTKGSNEILHTGIFTTGSVDGLCVGQCVRMTIDEATRRLHARLHSAGHLLDAALERMNVKDLIPSKGYHFADGPYVEYIGNVSNDQREKMIDDLNDVVAEIIKENIPTVVSFNDAGERVVNVANCPCPCGGTHVKSTAEIVGMKVVRMKKNKKNIKVSYTVEAS